MKMKFYGLTLLISFLLIGKTQAQKIEKKAFNESKVIRLYVSDSTKDEALIRFAKFIDKTIFTSYIPGETKNIETMPENQDKKMFQPKLVPIKQIDGSMQTGDTIKTNMATLFDVMFGNFKARLKFYPVKDDKNDIYIVLTGFVSNASTLGGKFSHLQMQKGGKNANWAQKNLFKQITQYVSEYENVNFVLYSDK